MRNFWLLITSLLVILISSLLYGFKNSISFYKTPSQLTEQDYRLNYQFRIGGLVSNPLSYDNGKDNVSFKLCDEKKCINVSYIGKLPKLFRLGQGCVVRGRFNPKAQIFIADQLLTKHSEEYHPPKKS